MSTATPDAPAAAPVQPQTTNTVGNPALDNIRRLQAEEDDAIEQDEQLAGAAEDKGKAEAGQAELDAAAAQGAAFIVGAGEALVKMRWDYVQIPQQLHDALIGAAIPVVKKRGKDIGPLPPMLEPYREELKLLAVIAATGFVISLQVKGHNQQQQQDTATAADNSQRANAAPPPPQKPAAAAVTPIRPAAPASADPFDPNYR